MAARLPRRSRRRSSNDRIGRRSQEGVAIVGSTTGLERTATLYDVAAARPVMLTGKEVVVVSANGLPAAMDGELSWTSGGRGPSAEQSTAEMVTRW